WSQVQELAKPVLDEQAKKQRGRPWYPPPLTDNWPFRSKLAEDVAAPHGLSNYRGPAVDFTRVPSVFGSFVLSQGPVKTKSITHSVLFVNGDITLPDKGEIAFCLVVCNGSIKCGFSGANVLIATGSIEPADGGFILPNAR